MNIIYLGAEVPSNRKILEACHVKNVGISFWRLKQRGLPKTKEYLIKNYFPEYMNVYVYPGLPYNQELNPVELEEFAADYEHFVAVNIDRIFAFTDFHNVYLPKGLLGQQRAIVFDGEEKFWPIYTKAVNYAELLEFAQKYPHIAVDGDLVDSDPSIAAKIKAVSSQFGTEFHALSYARPDALRGALWTTVSTMSWLSPMMRGETIVWDGNQILRYPARMKEQARPRYKAVCERAGLNFDKILEDDNVEVCRLAVWSYDQFETRFNMISGSGNDDLFNNLPELGMQVSTETPHSDIDNRGSGVRKLKPRNPAEMTTLPVFGVQVETIIEKDIDGRDVIKDVPVLSSNATSLRMCNTCFVAANCPAFKPDNMCAFNLPVEIKTKDQLKALLNAIIEMQGQRVAFARFSEELNGGYPDPNVGQEMDRLFKMLESIKKLEESSSFVKMTLESKGSSSGVLSSLFGERAQVLRELPDGGYSETVTDAIIQQSFE
jgi:hypothetical protein